MPKVTEKQKPFAAELTMAGESATLDVTGYIGWETEPMQFTDLVAQAKQAGCTHLTVRINSLGGYCYDGVAIGDCLRDCGMSTTAVVIGTAQSMASYILQCCDVREAHRGATIMFHQPSACVCGTVDEILTQAQYLVGLRDRMFEDMAARCGTTGPELSAEHQTMKIYTAQQALEKGFIDRISGAEDTTDDTTDDTSATDAATAAANPVQNACRVYEYERVEMAMAMVAAQEDTTDDTGDDTSDNTTDDTTADTTDAATDAATDDTTDDTTDDKPAPSATATQADAIAVPENVAQMVAAEVQRQLAMREAQMLAEMGAPASALPASAACGSFGVASRVQYTMAELDAMPAMQRLEVLRKNPTLAAAYAAHV